MAGGLDGPWLGTWRSISSEFAGPPLNDVASRAGRLLAGTSQSMELVSLKSGGENGCFETKNSANRDQLERNPSIQQCRPLNTYLHTSTRADRVSGEVLGDHQDATAAQIEGAAHARETR